MVGVPLESIGMALESMIRLLILGMHLVYGAKYHTELSTYHVHMVGVPLESVEVPLEFRHHAQDSSVLLTPVLN